MRAAAALLLLLAAGPARAAAPDELACEKKAVRLYAERYLKPRLDDNLAFFTLDRKCRLERRVEEPRLFHGATAADYVGARFWSVSPEDNVRNGFNPDGVLVMRSGDYLLPAFNYSDTQLARKFRPYPVARVTRRCRVELVDEDHARFLVKEYFGGSVGLGRRASYAELYKWVLAKNGRLDGDIGGSADPRYQGATFFFYLGEGGRFSGALRKRGKAWIEMGGVPKRLLLELIEEGRLAVNIYDLRDRDRSGPLQRHFIETGVPKMEVVATDEEARRRLLPYLVSRAEVPDDFRPGPYGSRVRLRDWTQRSLLELERRVLAACRAKGRRPRTFASFRLPYARICMTPDAELPERVDSMRRECRRGEPRYRSREKDGRRAALLLGQLLLEFPESRAGLCHRVALSIGAWQRHQCLK